MARAKQPDEMYVATTSGVIRIKGLFHRFQKGKTIVRRGDPLLVARPDLFKPYVVAHHGVEQATAAPGEEREVAFSEEPADDPADD